VRSQLPVFNNNNEVNKLKNTILKVKKLHPDAIAPSYANPGDSGLDLFPIEDFTLAPGEFKVIRTGIAIALPDGHEGQIRSRSGLATIGIQVLNSPSTIDNGYVGEIKVILINHGRDALSLKAGERANCASQQRFAIAQLVIAPVVQVAVEMTEELPSTVRGEKGFGSSDGRTS
jgi:dUTP pyrophosphatase